MPDFSKTPTTWNLSPLLTSDTDPSITSQMEAVRQANQKFAETWSKRTDYLEDATVLQKALDDYEKLQREYGTSGRYGYYFGLRLAQEHDNAVLKAQDGKSDELANQLHSLVQFFELSLAKVSPEVQKRFLQAPELKAYTHVLERLFSEAPYLLSEAEERIMTYKSATSHEYWIRLTSTLLAAEEREVLLADGSHGKKTMEEIMSLTSHPDKKVRDSAASAFNDILARHLNVAEAELNAVLRNKATNDELRHLPRPDLDRHLSDDISSQTVDAMLEAVSGRFDLSARYYRLKAKLLGVPKLAYYERSVEYGSVNQEYSYPEAMDLVHRTFIRLDPEFAEILERFATNGQIDAFPKTGKNGGAFCAGGGIAMPTYILLNHTDRLRDVLTIAHEAGHGINNELMRPVQNALSYGTPTSTAEVASTFMEDFVLAELLEKASPQEQLSILMMRLDGDIATTFRQVACYRFEQDLHTQFRAKGFLSKDEIGELFLQHMSSYMGEAVNLDPGSENWWTYWSHIRRFFYVYSYASGLLISKALQNMVKKDPIRIADVKKFLSVGISQSPQETFAAMGVHIDKPEFWKQGLQEVEALLEQTEKLAEQLT